MKQIALTATAIVGFAGMAQADFGPLVTPAELNDALSADAPVVLDIRGDAYADGHIDGAVSAPYALFRGPADNPGQIIPEEQLETTFETLGLSLDRPVVVVHQGSDQSDFGAAARVYWTLKSSGFTDLAILNGGASAWDAAGLPTSTEAVTPDPTDLDITFSYQWTADTDEVAHIVNGDEAAVLVDARPDDFYQGRKSHGAASRPGTLPEAEQLVHSSWFAENSNDIGGVANVTELKDSLGITDGEPVVSFCNTGHWAATNWFALSELAGIENVKLYPGSMVEYSKTDNRMANVPGLLKNLIGQIKGQN
ncbi:sulfurtransferase [Qingshengfaniella alkalisoli]|uniref:Sulfurtransferase n=1 Tax=Qingshengfaniella alkalisoli TaxID=2599296 RepID=A0A5B8I9T4_9RHOB|nr:rhodanese-like domain-containing protein [Qingshengfaniella alkalisoli]QDY70739.1 sulfurtransferase [Qingshengfaniella alkalisoli]